MAKLIYGLQQSLDGYVDHTEMGPTPALFRYFTEHVRNLAGSVYGRVTYGLMRYWDVDQPDWGAAEIDFAAAWGGTPFLPVRGRRSASWPAIASATTRSG
jgi:hypothetical protein